MKSLLEKRYNINIQNPGFEDLKIQQDLHPAHPYTFYQVKKIKQVNQEESGSKHPNKWSVISLIMILADFQMT